MFIYSKCGSLSPHDTVIKHYLMPVNDTVSPEKVSVCLKGELRRTSRLVWDWLWPKCTVACVTYVSHTASLAATPGGCVCVCVVMLGPPSTDEKSQLNRSYQSRVPLFKDLTDVKRVKVCGDEQRWFRREENTLNLKPLYMHTQRGSFELSFDNVTSHSYCIPMLFNWKREQETDGDS